MTMSECFERISGFEFTARDIEEAVARKGLLSIEIEFSRKCNFACAYCYVNESPDVRPELSPDEIRDILRQARALGARKIVILGGEPMIYPELLPMVAFIRSLGMDAEMFTNGTGITVEVARALLAHEVKVVLKMNSRDPAVQDRLSGRKGASAVIANAYAALRAAGYPGGRKLLGIGTVICRDNADDLVGFWQWIRDGGMEPYFEMITPQGHANENAWLDVPVATVHRLFREIADLDRTRYGIDWEPQPPLVAGRCLRHRFSCLVNAVGDVLPCVGVTIPVGNVRARPLADILRDSEVIQDLRNYTDTIKGPCGACERAAECYGCRGAAFQMTGDYLASDPLCWHNQSRAGEIERLPAAADGLVPHAAPMRVIDRLLAVGERTAESEATFAAGAPFADADGRIDEAVYPELVAQTIAAMNAFKQRRKAGASKGLLLGIKKFAVHGPARAGETLRTSIFKASKFGDFGVIEGVVRRGDEVLARGEVTIWHQA